MIKGVDNDFNSKVLSQNLKFKVEHSFGNYTWICGVD